MRSEEALKKLRGERHKGATFCAHLALTAFFEMESADHPVQIAEELLAAQPQMAPVVQIALRCLKHFENERSREEWIAECRKIKQEMEEAPERIAKRLADHPETGQQIMTISYSDTVFQALSLVAKERKLSVCTTEARPLCEGTLLAKRLSYTGIPVTLGVDGAALHLLEKCDAVWVGADAVGSTYFVNKIGTRALVLAAKVMQKPVYLLADELKNWPKRREWKEGTHNPDEVLAKAEPPLSVVNPYFEKIPLDWVKRVVTQKRVVIDGSG